MGDQFCNFAVNHVNKLYKGRDTVIILRKEILLEKLRNEAQEQMIILLEETKKPKKARAIEKGTMHEEPVPYLGSKQRQVCYWASTLLRKVGIAKTSTI